MSAILKQRRGHVKSLDSALCENEAGGLSMNQIAGLQCKIISANQGVLEYTNCVFRFLPTLQSITEKGRRGRLKG